MKNMEDRKSKAFRICRRRDAEDAERAYMETHCSEHARRWGERAGYEGSELAPIGHRGKYENWKDGMMKKFTEVQ